MDITNKTPLETMQQLALNARQRRLDLNLTQAGLAKRAGVSLGSLKRFEHNGEISLKSFLKLVFILGDISQTEKLFTPQIPFISLDDIMRSPPTRQRGSKS